MTEYALLHIPRTGGAARLASLHRCHGRIKALDHPVRQCDLPAGAVAIVYVRHPVERFRSLWSYVYARVSGGPFRTIDHLAQALPDASRDPEHEAALRPATWWLDGDPADLVVRTTEGMDRTWPRLMGALGIPADPLPGPGEPSRNESGQPHPELSAASVALLGTFYAADLAIWKDASIRPERGP